MDCIFCQIINKEKQADIVFENNNLIVFKDINPKAPVHLLIVPKKHIESLNELKNKDLAGDILLTARKIAQDHNIAHAYKVKCNVGKKGGQLVDHIHFHVLGGWNNYEK